MIPSIPQAYTSRGFAAEVTAIAAMTMKEQDAADFAEILPGLGIPSDFGVLADGVALGDSVIPRHGELLVMCLSMVSARTGRVYQPLHSADPVALGGHTGPAMVDAMLRAMERHPAHWGIATLRQRLSCVGGDGVLVVGGPDARHNSPGSADMLWRRVHPTATGGDAAASAAGSSANDPIASAGSSTDVSVPICPTWEPFHRVDIAVWRAVRRSQR